MIGIKSWEDRSSYMIENDGQNDRRNRDREQPDGATNEILISTPIISLGRESNHKSGQYEECHHRLNGGLGEVPGNISAEFSKRGVMQKHKSGCAEPDDVQDEGHLPTERG